LENQHVRSYGPRPKSGKSRLNLHGTILEENSIGSNPQIKEKSSYKRKLMIWRTKMQVKVQDQKKWQIKAKLTLHHFGRKFNWFKPQTKEKSSNKRKLMIWITKMQAKVQDQKNWQIKAKPTLHHFGRNFNWFKPQTKEKSSKESS
jgi:hypothetical protein